MIVVTFLVLLMYFLSYGNEIKLLSKKIPPGYYNTFNTNKYLFIVLEYKRDKYIIAIEKEKFKAKVVNVEGFISDIKNIGNEILYTSKNKNRVCIYTALPEPKERLCLFRERLEKKILKATEYRENLSYKEKITPEGNLAVLLKPRKAYNLTEMMFGKLEYEGRFVVISKDRKVLLDKKLSTEYKHVYLTNKGVFSIKNKNLVNIDFTGKEKIIKKGNFTTLEYFDDNLIVKEKKKKYLLHSSKLIPINKKCIVKYKYIVCRENETFNIFSIADNGKFLVKIDDYFSQFLCKSRKYLIFKNADSIFFLDIKGKLKDKFTIEDSLSVECFDGILMVKKPKYIVLYKVLEQ